MRVLVIEDQVDSAEFLTLYLNRMGFEVRIATTCEEAKQVFADYLADVCVMDLGLPDGNGCDLLHELINVRDVPAIAVTGRSTPDDIKLISECGFKTWLIKPVAPEEIVAAIRQVCTIKRLIV